MSMLKGDTSKVGMVINVCTPKEIMKFWAFGDAVLKHGHNWLSASDVKPFYWRRLKESYVTFGGQTDTDIHHYISAFHGRVRVKKVLQNEIVMFQLFPHIKPEDFYVEAIKAGVVENFVSDPKRTGLGIPGWSRGCSPPVGMKIPSEKEKRELIKQRKQNKSLGVR